MSLRFNFTFVVLFFSMRVLRTNILATHKSYGKILLRYNEMLQTDGKVNDKKFYEQVILGEIPNYKLQSWYQFLRRFKTETGIVAVLPKDADPKPLNQGALNAPLETIANTMLSNTAATAKFIQMALNISADRARQVMENPQLLSAKEALDLGVKAMKAQDSRIHAVGKIREDTREQEKFDRAFDEAAYGD